ncbi:uncharacterized protein LOC106656167 [Trichogramma pretiosum]|uniref:uncharacterized protein LOC106656167 n=1 Tax=Trichogramma pretiosum TaxID=7493 RepID=UPI0006C96AF9|nr:uncharacterized protein LOC106656167 [Trichogramma pretiosum]
MDSNAITTPKAKKPMKRVNKKSISKEAKKAQASPKEKTDSETDTASEGEAKKDDDSGTDTAAEEEMQQPRNLTAVYEEAKHLFNISPFEVLKPLTRIWLAAQYVELQDALSEATDTGRRQ